MKFALIAMAVLAAATSAQANLLPSAGSAAAFISGKSIASGMSFEAANRKGSTRVGGSGRSGKGGKSVGGRK